MTTISKYFREAVGNLGEPDPVPNAIIRRPDFPEGFHPSIEQHNGGFHKRVN